MIFQLLRRKKELHWLMDATFTRIDAPQRLTYGLELTDLVWAERRNPTPRRR